MAEEKTAAPKKAVTAKKKSVASKRTLNLAFHESSLNPKRLIPIALVVILCGLLFAKFGFLDQFARKTAAYNELAEKQAQLQAINNKLMGYDELAEKYGRYSYGWMTDTEASLVDRMDVLDILENTIYPVAHIQDFAVNNNILAVNISGLTLDQTSALVQQLEDHPLISSVSVYSATSEDPTSQAKIAMTIILEKGGEEND